MELTKEYVRSLFDYDPVTGNLLWKVQKSLSVKIGSAVGAIRGKGYRETTIDNRHSSVHRLVWIWHNGSIPKGQEIDHLNHERADNRIENLRCVSRQDNLRNASRYSTNKSGRTGVWFDKIGKRWIAHITIDGRFRYLGSFRKKNLAVKCREEAERDYGFHTNHGQSRNSTLL